MRFVVHIGHPKTGTTAVQTSLGSSREVLRAAGILYPSSIAQRGAHHTLALAFRPPRPKEAPWVTRHDRPELAAMLDEEIGASDAHTVILSSELLYRGLATSEFLAFIGRWADEVDVVAVLRRQDSWLEAAFAQRSTTGFFHGSPQTFMQAALENQMMDFSKALASWFDTVGPGRTHITPMDPGHNRIDALEVVLDHIDDAPALERAKHDNARMARDAIELLCAMPEEHRNGKMGVLRRDLREWSATRTDPSGWEHFYSVDDRRWFLDQHRESNAALATVKAMDPPELFVGEPQPPESQYPGLSIERAAELARYLWVERASRPRIL